MAKNKNNKKMKADTEFATEVAARNAQQNQAVKSFNNQTQNANENENF
ncbi:hypothetical protein [Paenibacillus cremeus]|nr:hypothetical protein [Paenibacillus cremeus]